MVFGPGVVVRIREGVDGLGLLGGAMDVLHFSENESRMVSLVVELDVGLLILGPVVRRTWAYGLSAGRSPRKTVASGSLSRLLQLGAGQLLFQEGNLIIMTVIHYRFLPSPLLNFHFLIPLLFFLGLISLLFIIVLK